MKFEWDEDKRLRTLERCDLDFRAADLFFDGRLVVRSPTPREGEESSKTTANIKGTFYMLVWTPRGDIVRIITISRAHESEERAYRSLHP